MNKKSEPWYIHAALTVVILVLAYILIQVAYVAPKEVIDNEKYWTTESRTRMNNIREAEILWKKDTEKFTDSIDSLINFVTTDSAVQALVNGFDSTRMKSTNPFDTLWNGTLNFDSLRVSPKSGDPYVLKINRETRYDTIVDRRGNIKDVDTVTVWGTRYYLECPDGYGTIGDLEKDALINTASWD